ADTCCIPGYTATTLTNASASAPAFLFIADESPLHRKLGVYEVRPDNQPHMP
ncbi:MAG: cupin, partial [Hydrogenophaga sp.]|nr:cupin [Hydrogenophaga sp.]